MNQQTIAVTAGTLVLLALGAVLLYSSPGDPPPPNERPVAGAKAPGKTPAQAKAKAAPEGPKKVPVAKLVSERPIPDDRVDAPEGAPNVVVVLSAAVRRDQLTPYDGPPDTMPFLAQQVAQGVRFDDALANAVWPKPAQVALLTGRLPHDVGMVEPATDKKNTRRLPAEVDTLAERFAEGGWTTLGATASHYLTGRFGMRQGFDWYRESQPFGYLLEARMGAREVVSSALQGVAARKDKERPVYLQLAFIDSHKPFRVPPDEFHAFDGPDHKVSPYRATLRRQDVALQQLVEGLASHGLTPENTIFVFVGEHGEGLDMPPAHRKQHGRVLYHSSVGIPWVMWGGGLPRGKTVQGLASQIDLAPTVLSLAGVPGPREGLDGIDHSEAVRAGGTTKRTEHYADTMWEGTHRASLWTATHQCQRDFGSTIDDDDGFVDGCFDRAADPDFTTAGPLPLSERLAAEHEARMAALRAAEARAAADADADGE
jgi:hypothetical protein